MATINQIFQAMHGPGSEVLLTLRLETLPDGTIKYFKQGSGEEVTVESLDEEIQFLQGTRRIIHDELGQLFRGETNNQAFMEWLTANCTENGKPKLFVTEPNANVELLYAIKEDRAKLFRTLSKMIDTWSEARNRVANGLAGVPVAIGFVPARNNA